MIYLILNYARCTLKNSGENFFFLAAKPSQKMASAKVAMFFKLHSFYGWFTMKRDVQLFFTRSWFVHKRRKRQSKVKSNYISTFFNL